jgi:hypothetical protein
MEKCKINLVGDSFTHLTGEIKDILLLVKNQNISNG